MRESNRSQPITAYQGGRDGRPSEAQVAPALVAAAKRGQGCLAFYYAYERVAVAPRGTGPSGRGCAGAPSLKD